MTGKTYQLVQENKAINHINQPVFHGMSAKGFKHSSGGYDNTYDGSPKVHKPFAFFFLPPEFQQKQGGVVTWLVGWRSIFFKISILSGEHEPILTYGNTFKLGSQPAPTLSIPRHSQAAENAKNHLQNHRTDLLNTLDMLGDLLQNFKKLAGHYELAHIFSFYVEKMVPHWNPS